MAGVHAAEAEIRMSAMTNLEILQVWIYTEWLEELTAS